MRRQQKTATAGYLNEGMLETKSNLGAQSTASLETERKDGVENLLEKMLHRDNLNEAYKRVKNNKGAAGIDNMSVGEMLAYLKENKEELLQSLREGKYKPKAVRAVEIPKPDVSKRQLGIPTVVDRMIQQALAQVLQPVFEPTFSNNSYGFRPGRNAHMAIRQAKKYYEEGYCHVVDIDLEKYFDTVNHDILINKIREKVSDERIINLIRKYLKSGILKNGIIRPSDKGTPQGGNLSPLLSNIYLTAFDKELEKRGHKFVRYADDCNIYVRSKRGAQRVLRSCKAFLENRLKLKVNEKKSETGSPLKRKFLGFTLYSGKNGIGIRTHEKSIAKLKKKIKELTSRKQANSIYDIFKKMKQYTTGWLSYYKIADMQKQMSTISEWIRRRMRQIYWKQWKKPQTKFKNLKALGITEGKAWEWANSRKKYWRVSKSPILHRALTNKYLVSQGYDDIAERYKALHETC